MEKPSKREWTLLNANESNKNSMMLKTLDLDAFEYHRYPDADATALKLSVVNELNATVQMFEPDCAYTPLTPDNIVMGTGSDEILKLILEAVLTREGVVLIPSPSFSEYKKITEIVKGKLVELASEDLVVTASDLIACANRENAQVIFLANPNNPTGQLMTLKDIERLATETEAIIVVDEAYAEFSAMTAIKLALINPRIIVTRTLSKAYGLASLRLGYAVAQPQVIEQLSRLKLTYNISGISEWLAIKALQNTEEVRRYIDQVVQLRGKAIWLMQQFSYLNVYPSAANFILFEVKEAKMFEQLMLAFEAAKIRVRTFEQAEGKLRRCVRLTLTDELEFMKAFTLLKTQGGANGCCDRA